MEVVASFMEKSFPKVGRELSVHRGSHYGLADGLRGFVRVLQEVDRMSMFALSGYD